MNHKFGIRTKSDLSLTVEVRPGISVSILNRYTYYNEIFYLRQIPGLRIGPLNYNKLFSGIDKPVSRFEFEFPVPARELEIQKSIL